MPKGEAGAVGADDKQLAADVRAFAAQLGLGSGGGDGAFDDFAPQKAAQRIGGGKAKPAKQQQQQGQQARGASSSAGGSAAASPSRAASAGAAHATEGEARHQEGVRVFCVERQAR